MEPLPSPGEKTQHAQPTLTIRPATPNDIPSIAHLGTSTFTSTFGHSLSPEDLNAYLSEAYSHTAIASDLSNPGISVFVACFTHDRQKRNQVESQGRDEKKSRDVPQNGNENQTVSENENQEINPEAEIVGFVQLNTAWIEPCITTPRSSTIELQRIYVGSPAQGRGVGKSLLGFAEKWARGRAFTTLWLGVWEENLKARGIYEGVGFARVGEHGFKMGGCVQTDWIMCKSLEGWWRGREEGGQDAGEGENGYLNLEFWTAREL